MTHAARPPTAYALTRGPSRHFFGYYNMTPWDATGRYMLALEVDFQNHPPRPGDVARIGLIDTHNDCGWQHLAETRAWNWQQGCMMQWAPSQPDRLIIYNDLVDQQPVAMIRDVFTGHTHMLPHPVYALNQAGTEALSLNFARLHRLRPGYGYVGLPDLTRYAKHPDTDGVFGLNMATGDSRLIITLRQLASIAPLPSMRGATHWVNHLLFNSDGTRFVFLHRWEQVLGSMRRFVQRACRKARQTLSPTCALPILRHTRMLTARPDGSDLRILADDGMVSHYDWRDPHHLLGWARTADRGDHYYLFDDRNGVAETVGEDVLTVDGHCTYSPDRKWILTDTYPDRLTRRRTLILYHVEEGRRVNIGEYLAPPEFDGEIRCDLHPRWNRDGTQICFDSLHEGSRQIYVVNVGDIVAEG